MRIFLFPLTTLAILITLEQCMSSSENTDVPTTVDNTIESGENPMVNSENETYQDYMGLSIEFLNRLKKDKTTKSAVTVYANL